MLRALSLCLLAALTAPAALAQADLFVPSASKRADLTPRQAELLAALESEPGTGAVQLVTANAGLLGQAEAVSVDLPTGARIALETETVERRASDDLSWSATASAGGAALVARGGWLTGSIWHEGTVYVVRPLTGGLHAIAAFDATGLKDHPDDYDEILGEHAPVQPEPGQNVPPPDHTDAQKGGAALVDVLVVYTADLVANTADPVAFAQAAIDYTNTSYANSDVSTRIRMVYAHQTPDASTPTVGTQRSPDLSNLTGTSDGTFDEVHGIRDAYGADMVALIGPSSTSYGYCGVAYLNPGATGAFSVTARNCAIGNLSFAHELGHNFGAQHNAGNGAPAYPYGLGTVAEPTATEGSWRSVMAYNNCNVGPCTRLPQWSNPDVVVRGTVSGDAASRDNARVMDERGPTVGAFRATVVSPPTLSYSPGSLSPSAATDGTDTATLTIQNDAASGGSNLEWGVAFENVQVPGGPPPNACTGTQVLSQPTRTTVTNAPTQGNQGQSFTALCSGDLTTVSPKIYAQFTPNTTWAGTLYVYDGEGTSGTQLAAAPVSIADNGNTEYNLDIVLPTPVEVVSGQSYTWFLQVTSGTTSLLYANSDVYAEGQRYASAGTPAGATAFATNDMDFNATFAPTSGWATASATSGSVAPGASASTTLTFDATGLPAGTYTADLVLTSNDVDALSTTLPVTFFVGAGTATATIDGEAGWRLFAPAAPGMTVADLAGMNRVSGIPGYDEFNDPNNPGASNPSLFTGYDGTNIVAATGGSEALALGEGFWWYLYDANFSDGPTNQSYALPFTLATPLPPTSEDVDVPLHADGNKVNLLGNPFGQSLDLSGSGAWPGRANLLTPVFAVYDSGTNSYAYSTSVPVVSAWQGFYAYGKTAGTLTIPESARTTGGMLRKDAAPDDRVFLALELTEDVTGREPLADRGAVLYFDEGASAGEDAWDLAELAPLDWAHVTLAFGAENARGRTVLRGHEGRAPGDGAFEIPLHVRAVGAAETLTLSWPTLERLPADWSISLRDVETGATVDLRAQASYTFPSASAPAPPVAGPAVPSTEATEMKSEGVPVRFVLSVVPSRTATSTAPGAESELALLAPRPNPSRERATVRFVLAEAGEATVSVFDVQGREIARLAEGERAPGAHEVVWRTDALASGVYVLRLVSADRVLTRRAVVAR